MSALAVIGPQDPVDVKAYVEDPTIMARCHPRRFGVGNPLVIGAVRPDKTMLDQAACGASALIESELQASGLAEGRVVRRLDCSYDIGAKVLGPKWQIGAIRRPLAQWRLARSERYTDLSVDRRTLERRTLVGLRQPVAGGCANRCRSADRPVAVAGSAI